MFTQRKEPARSNKGVCVSCVLHTDPFLSILQKKMKREKREKRVKNKKRPAKP